MGTLPTLDMAESPNPFPLRTPMSWTGASPTSATAKNGEAPAEPGTTHGWLSRLGGRLRAWMPTTDRPDLPETHFLMMVRMERRLRILEAEVRQLKIDHQPPESM